LEGLPLESSDRVIFLGDYIDRGPDSQGVVNYLLDWRSRQSLATVFLKGNHEDMFLSYLGLAGKHGDAFLFNGGAATLASYGISPAESPPQILSRVPPDHVRFFKELRTHYAMERFLCVHAGVHPQKSLGQQSEEELLWIRDPFIQHTHSLPYTVIFGHTPHRDVFFHLPYKIGLDTGLVYGNLLSCLEVSEKVLFQIKKGHRSVSRRNVHAYWKEAPRTLTFSPGSQ
jgi:serine/threonine protein phosphatase 1